MKKIRRRIKMILSMCVIGVLLIFVIMRYNPWVILPTTSSPYTLTLVRNGYPNIHKITLKHYVNDVIINNYILDLKTGLRHQQPQKYKLPKVNEGRVELVVELEDGIICENNSAITINYNQGNNFYNKGVLIFLTTDYISNKYINNFVYYDQYIYFVSGKEKTYYFEKAGSSEWSFIGEAPQLRRFTSKSKGMGYTPFYYGWKENEWVCQGDGSTDTH